MTREDPTFGVLVLTCDRRSALSRCLTSLVEQTAQVQAYLVVDNASADGSAQLVRSQFPQFDLLQNDRNLGCPAGRNRGVAHLATDYVICVDDDGSVRPDFLARCRAAVHRFPDAAVISGYALDAYHAAPPAEAAPAFSFLGGVCVLHRETFVRLGGYHEDALRQGEERELAFQLYEQGHLVVADPSIRLDHHVDETVERRVQVLASNLRQSLLTSVKYHPGALVPVTILWRVLSHYRVGLRLKAWRSLGRASGQALRQLPQALAQRRPIAYRTFLASTRWYRPPAVVTSVWSVSPDGRASSPSRQSQ